MKTPNLFDVPKQAPSKRDRLTAFMKENGIQTHHATGLTREEHPWCACHMPSAVKFGYGVTENSDMFDCVSKVGRLLDEAGVLTTGYSERDAVCTLAQNLEIPFTL